MFSQVSQKAESEEECANACKADENCAMFSFWESLKMCALLSDDLEWNEKPEEGREVVSQQFTCIEKMK